LLALSACIKYRGSRGWVVQEHVEKLLAALIILALLVLLIIITWPISTNKIKQALSPADDQKKAQTTNNKKLRRTSLKDRYDVSASTDRRSSRMAMRYDGDRTCGNGWEGDCDREPSPPPRYDNYGYEIRREPCRDDDGPCYCEDSWRPYWAWPRRRCY
jgi:hypothetical protein